MRQIVGIENGNILQSPMQTLVCPVNCIGAMGKGLAEQMRRAFPGLYEAYRVACAEGDVAIGKLWVWDVPGSDKKILCFPTKQDWHYNSKLEWIELGLDIFSTTYMEMGITSIAWPPLGCGEGGLDWREVRNAMRDFLTGIPIPMEIYVWRR